MRDVPESWPLASGLTSSTEVLGELSVVSVLFSLLLTASSSAEIAMACKQKYKVAWIKIIQGEQKVTDKIKTENRTKYESC